MISKKELIIRLCFLEERVTELEEKFESLMNSTIELTDVQKEYIISLIDKDITDSHWKGNTK